MTSRRKREKEGGEWEGEKEDGKKGVREKEPLFCWTYSIRFYFKYQIRPWPVWLSG